MDLIRQCHDILTNPAHASWIGPLLWLGDAVLSAGIIWKIPYTEIDWTAYMQQVDIYLKGQRDYAHIEGATGPLVYPGLHVYIYRVLHALTDGGANLLRAQIIFMGLYLASLAVVMACYRNAKVPPYVYPLLILSKRLHSIYTLRLFNDCFAVLFMYLAIYLYQRRAWHLGTTLFTCGLGVKMNLLLLAPGLAFVMLQALGIDQSFTQALIVTQSQGLFAYEFVRVNWRSYVGRAFQLNRQFLYQWTVNWRFVPEATFLSSPFSLGLLSAHAALLLLFAATRWVKPAGRSLGGTMALYLTKQGSSPDELEAISRRITPQYVMTTLLTANSIGMLCARSLHYQFYSWTAWATPFLLWRAGFHPVLTYAIWAAQEWAWNVYPSTDASSAVVVACLGVTVAGVWWGTRNEYAETSRVDKKRSKNE